VTGEAIIVDGGIGGDGLDSVCVLTRTVPAASDERARELQKDGPVASADAHAGRCAEVLASVYPSARVHSVRVFDDRETTAERALAGLERALALAGAVICLPWAMSETRLEEPFEAACDQAAGNGVIVVAARPAGEPRVIPAGFPSVVAVSGRRPKGQTVASLAWSDRLEAVVVPASASMGSALVAGLALVFVEYAGARGVASFVRTLKAFAADGATMVDVPRSPDEWRLFVTEKVGNPLGAAFREHLERSTCRLVE